MRKFNWKLLLVVVLVVAMVMTIVACNDKKDDQKEPAGDQVTITYSLGDCTEGTAPAAVTVDKGTPITLPAAPTWTGHTFTGWLPAGATTSLDPSATYIANESITITAQWTTTGGGGGENPPGPTPTTDPSQVFFDELYNVASGIGNEAITAGSNVYFNADLGLALGTRKAGGTAENGFKLGIRVQGIFDTADGSDTAVRLDLTSGQVTIASIYFKASDNIAYVDLGGQKVKINTQLVGLGKILTDALGKDIVTADATNYGSINSFVTAIAGEAGPDFTLDTLLTAVLNKLGKLDDFNEMLADMLPGNMEVNFQDEQGYFNIKKALSSSFIREAFEATNSGENHSAKLVSTDIKGLLAAKLGAQDGIGDIDINISFSSDNNHILKNGVKIAADLIVDPANSTLVDKLGQGVNPFVELTINSLHVKDANNKSIAPANTTEYSSDLYFNVKEYIEVKGIQLAGPIAKMTVQAVAKLDLERETDNQTELRLYFNTKYSDFSGEHDVNGLDLTYKKGTLSLSIDNNAAIISQYLKPMEMFLAEPIGQLIDSILPAEQKTAFDALFWTTKYDSDYRPIGVKYNEKFQGITIEHLDVKTILGLIMNSGNGGEQDSPVADAGTADEAQGTSINIFNTIGYFFSLIKGNEDGKLSFGLHDLFSVVGEVGDMFGFELDADSVADTVSNLLIGMVKLLGDNPELVTVEGTDNSHTNPLKNKFLYLFGSGETDNNLTFDFDLTTGIRWDLYWLRHGEVTEEDLVDDTGKDANGNMVGGELSLRYTSDIEFSTKAAIFGEGKEMIDAAKKYYDAVEGIAGAEATVSQKEKAYNDAKTAYESTESYKTYLGLNDTATEKKTAYNSALNAAKALTDYGGTSTKFTPAYLINEYDKAYQAWIKEGKPAEETAPTKKALTDAETAFTTNINLLDEEINALKQGNATPLMTEYITAYKLYLTKQAEYNTAKAASDAAPDDAGKKTAADAAKTAMDEAKTASDTLLNRIKGLLNKWNTYNTKLSLYTLLARDLNAYITAQKAWEDDGSKTEGELYTNYTKAQTTYNDCLAAAKEAIKDAEDAAGLVQKFLDVWNGKDQTVGLKKAIEEYRDANKAATDAKTTAQTTEKEKYDAMNNAQSEQTAAQNALKALQDIVKAWFHWDIEA